MDIKKAMQLVVTGTPRERIAAAGVLGLAGEQGWRELARIAMNDGYSSDVRLAAADGFPDQAHKLLIQDVFSRFLASEDAALRCKAIVASVRRGLFALLPSVAACLHDEREVWDLDVPVQVKELAREAVPLLRQRETVPSFRLE